MQGSIFSLVVIIYTKLNILIFSAFESEIFWCQGIFFREF